MAVNLVTVTGNLETLIGSTPPLGRVWFKLNRPAWNLAGDIFAPEYVEAVGDPTTGAFSVALQSTDDLGLAVTYTALLRYRDAVDGKDKEYSFGPFILPTGGPYQLGDLLVYPIPPLDDMDVLDGMSLSLFGAIGDGITDDSAAIQNALMSGYKRLFGVPGSTYYINSTVKAAGVIGVTLDLTGCNTTQGNNALPGVYFLNCTNCHILSGNWTGNYDTAGVWESLSTTGGITDGGTTGASVAAYSGVSTISINGLGTGYVRKGDRVSYITAGVTYGYIVQADVLIAAGVAAVTLDRVLDAATTLGQTIWVDQGVRRQCIPTAYSSGVSSITVGAADVTSATGSPRLVAGDQFCFHTNKNEINSIDYSEVYTVVANSAYSGTYPNVSATVTITPALVTSKVLGQRITSIQDVRNNKHSLILFYGCEDCTVEDVRISRAQLHGIAMNATIRSPWEGVNPDTAANHGCKIINCTDDDSETGSSFVAGHATDFRVTGSTSRGSINRNGVQMEQCVSGIITNNIFDGIKDGVMVTGETKRVTIADNAVKNCQIGIEQRNICREIVITGNTIVNDPAFSLYGIRVEAGYRDESLLETTYNSLCIIQANTVTGRCIVSGSFNGSSILVTPPTAATTGSNSVRPHYVQILDNIITYAGRHGISILRGVRGRCEGNTVFNAGYSGIYGVNCEDFDFIRNTVIDAGVTSANGAFQIDGGTGIVFIGNRADVTISTGQSWGLDTINTPTFRVLDGNIMRGTVAGNVASVTDDVSSAGFGHRALESRLLDGVRNTAGGGLSGRQVTTGDNNTMLGYSAGLVLTTGNRNTLIGAATAVDAGSRSNAIALGYGAIPKANGEIALGDDAGATNGIASAKAID